MPDVHVPKLDAHGSGHSIFKILLEVILIGTGVFLGLAGEQWRERSHQRELADQSLRRFRTEIQENRKAVAGGKDYHFTLQKELSGELSKTPSKRSDENVHFHGINSANFDHAAWDLALGTQSLAYMDADLTRGLLQAMYITPPVEDKNTTTFFGAVLVYLGDITLYEPRLLGLYDDALQKIDKALGEKK